MAVSARPGEASRQVAAGGLRVAIGMRVATLVPTVVVAVAAADGRMRWTTTAAMVALVAWSAVYVTRLRGSRSRLVSVLDALVMCGLAAGTSWVTPVSWTDTGKTWIRPFANFATVGYQYSTPGPLGIALGAAVCLSVSAATNLARPGPPGPDGVISAIWIFATVLLARLLWFLVARAAARADGMLADAERARADRAVAAGLRADERAVTNALHDTAATTLLMIGLGQAGGLGETLRRRAARDLALLRGIRTGVAPGAAPGMAPGVVELVGDLRTAAELAGVRLALRAPARVEVGPEAGRALSDAAGEALVNVAKHSGQARATVTVTSEQTRVVIEIRDFGTGFDPESVPATRRGLRESIAGRMAAIDGTAAIDSRPGHGTTVTLHWPRPAALDQAGAQV